MPPRIPPPEYMNDAIAGAVYDLPGGMSLIVGDVPDALADLAPVISGLLVVRYGIQQNLPSVDAIIPGLFVSEYGAALTGRAAWEFMQERFQLHPRADVIGLNTKGGEAQVFLRELDWGARVRVFVYDSPGARRPAAEVTWLVVGQNAPEIPCLLAEYLPAAGDLVVLLAPPEA